MGRERERGERDTEREEERDGEMREMGERERGRRNRAREKESDREMRDIGGGGGEEGRE